MAHNGSSGCSGALNDEKFHRLVCLRRDRVMERRETVLVVDWLWCAQENRKDINSQFQTRNVFFKGVLSKKGEKDMSICQYQ